MKRLVFLIAAFLVVAGPAGAAEKKNRNKAPPAGRVDKESATPAVDPKLKDASSRARFLFIRRVELCAPPQRCDRDTLGIIDEAEQRFVAACQACASEKKCEDDRATVRSGKAQSNFNPCE